MITIDKDQAIALLARAVALRGAGYIDPGTDTDNCQYLDIDKPGCIIGLALHFAGADNEVLREWDAKVESLCTHSPPPHPHRISFPGVELDRGAFDVFREAQRHQDGGGNWGDALTAAKRVAAPTDGSPSA